MCSCPTSLKLQQQRVPRTLCVIICFALLYGLTNEALWGKKLPKMFVNAKVSAKDSESNVTIDDVNAKVSAKDSESNVTIDDVNAKVSAKNSDSNVTIDDVVAKRGVTIDDVTITVKTTKRFHEPRVGLLLKTWMKRVLKQTFVITDAEDKELEEKLGAGHLVVTKCGATHALADLCCKTSKEFDTFATKNTSWWCHFDDDVYVNIESLLDLLNNYDPIREYIYVGRQSRPAGFDANVRGRKQNVKFLTGAGYCVSKSLQQFMEFWVGNNELVASCRGFGHADDVSMGAIITYVLKVPMSESLLFHSPFDQSRTPLNNISEFKKQVTYSNQGLNKVDLTRFGPAFGADVDPTRHLSIHCILYPDDVICPKTQASPR